RVDAAASPVGTLRIEVDDVRAGMKHADRQPIEGGAEEDLAQRVAPGAPAADPHVVDVQQAERLPVVGDHRGGVAQRQITDLRIRVEPFEALLSGERRHGRSSTSEAYSRRSSREYRNQVPPTRT